MSATTHPTPVDVTGIYLPDELCWVFDVDDTGDPVAECWSREGIQPLATLLRIENGWLAVPHAGNQLTGVGFGATPAAAWAKAT